MSARAERAAFFPEYGAIGSWLLLLRILNFSDLGSGGMGNPLYRDYEKLVEITILGKKFQVPEKNICLRAFQFISPETIPYGRFCWNQECQLCRVGYTMAGQDNVPVRPVLACKVLVADGMQIVQLSDELKWTLMGVLKPAEPRPPLE